jgi:hypothetical protein
LALILPRSVQVTKFSKYRYSWVQKQIYLLHREEAWDDYHYLKPRGCCVGWGQATYASGTCVCPWSKVLWTICLREVRQSYWKTCQKGWCTSDNNSWRHWLDC